MSRLDENGDGDGDGAIDERIELENSYYEGDDIKGEDPHRAIELFNKVVEIETKLGENVKWRFKSLQRLVTIYFSLSQYEKMIASYRSMLDFMSSVTRNECTDAINTILDTLTSVTNSEVLSEMYKITLIALKTAKNERLWFNTNLKLARIYMDGGNITGTKQLLHDLKQTCQTEDGQDDPNKGSYLLEMYCLEIQLCSLLHDSAKMKEVYPKVFN